MKAFVLLLTLTATAAASEVQTFKLATGEMLVHAFKDGVPLPSDSKWAVVQGAGPSFSREGNEPRIAWNVILKPKGAPALLRAVERATVQEVSGSVAVAIFDGPVKTTQDAVVLTGPANAISRASQPWLYTAEPSLFVFRVILFKGGEQDKLLQPVVIGPGPKRKLREAGYLP